MHGKVTTIVQKTTHNDDTNGESEAVTDADEVDRRGFLKLLGLSGAGLGIGALTSTPAAAATKITPSEVVTDQTRSDSLILNSLTADPNTVEQGQMFYRSDVDEIRYSPDGAATKQIGGGADWSSIANKPTLPEGVSSAVILRMQLSNAEQRFAATLAQRNYDDSFVDPYVDQSRVASSNNVIIAGGADGNVVLSIASGEGGYSVSNVVYIQTKDESSQLSYLQRVAFNDNGTKMWALGRDDGIKKYDLSSNFDISTDTYQGTDVFLEADDPRDMVWNNDGTKVYTVDSMNDSILEYSLSTPYDLDTKSHSHTWDVSSDASSPYKITWNDDGTKIYVADNGGNELYEYDLGTAFDISTASLNQSFDISSEDSVPRGIAWNDDGTKLFYLGSGNDKVYEYDCSTPYDISTLSLSQSFDVTEKVGVQPSGMTWANNGSKLYLTNSGTNEIVEFDVGDYETSGTVTSVSKDLGYSPDKMQVIDDATVPANTDLSYTLRDENGNTVDVPRSALESDVDTSALTGTQIELLSNFSSDGSSTPTQHEVGWISV